MSEAVHVSEFSYSHFSILHFNCQRSMKFKKLTPRGRGLGCVPAPLLDFHCVHHPSSPLVLSHGSASSGTSQGFQPVYLLAIPRDSLQVPWQSLFKSHSFRRSSVLLRVASSLLDLDILTLSPLYLIQISFPPLSSNLMILKGIFLDWQILLFST